MRSDPTPRAAKVFAKTVTGPEATARTVRGRHAMAIGPKGNLAATRNFPVAAGIATATPGIASATPADRGPRKDFGNRPERGADRGEFKAVAEARCFFA